MPGERNTNQAAVPGAERALDNFKFEVATELGVTLGGDRPSRENGRVGGEMTKRMVQLAEQQLQGGAAIPAGGGVAGRIR